MVIRADSATEALPTHGIPLGIFADSEYEWASLTLGVGDVLFLYSDGLNEARGRDGSFYGQERLRSLMKGLRRLPTEEISAGIRKSFDAWCGAAQNSDDFTYVLLKRVSG